MVQCLRLHAPSATRGTGFNPAQRTRSHMPQLKSLHAATEDLVQIFKKAKEEHFSENSFFFPIVSAFSLSLKFPFTSL